MISNPVLLDAELSDNPDLRYSAVRVGIQDTEVFGSWLSRRHQASMSYLSREERVQKASDTSLISKNSKSLIVFLLNYKRSRLVEDGYGRIASYAGATDYHKFFPRMIDHFVMENRLFIDVYKTYVDTGPLLERNVASISALGWIGKNSMLINRSIGSFTFIGAVVTDLPVNSSSLPSPDLCGRCSKCIVSCPTGAINAADRTVDSNLCISYHTIENRGIIPKEISEKMDDMIFGCDICNDVCPWNGRTRQSSVPEVQEGPFTSKMKLEEIAFMDKESFDASYGGSAVKRATVEGLARNAVIALHNSGRENLVREVRKQFEGLRGKQASLLLDEKYR